MNRTRKRKLTMAALLALAAAGTLTVVAPSPALAAASSSAIANTNGTRAAEAFFNRRNGTHGNRAWFDVYDAKCDAEPVLVQYDLTSLPGGLESSLNDGGCGTTAGVNLPTGYFTIKYRACVQDGGPFTNDTCSNWVYDHS
jgi:hypothetical protein